MIRSLRIALMLILTGSGSLFALLHAVEGSAIAATQTSQYTCAMHPRVHSDHPGECPICHMQLVAVKSGGQTPPRTEKREKKIKFYRNPMDPSIHSDVPAKDSMGMDYIPVYESDEETKSPEKAVNGRTTFNLTPEQLKLSGTRIVSVEKRDLVKELHVPGRSLGGDRISFQIYEEDLAYVKPGLRFIADAPALPGDVLTGKVTSVESILDPMTRTARVNATLDGKYRTLRTESSLTGKLQLKLTGVVAVPETAIFHTGSKDLVFVTDGNGSFQPRSVDLGTKAQGYYEIKDGLNPGEQVSAGPNFLMDSESRIQFGYDSSNH